MKSSFPIRSTLQNIQNGSDNFFILHFTDKTTDQISTNSKSTFSQLYTSKLKIGTGIATTFSWLGERVSSILPAKASSTPHITQITTTIAATTPSSLHTTPLGTSTSVSHPPTIDAVTSDTVTTTRAKTTFPDTTALGNALPIDFTFTTTATTNSHPTASSNSATTENMNIHSKSTDVTKSMYSVP